MMDIDNGQQSEEGASGYLSLKQVEVILDERFDVEALAQTVEHLDFAEKLSQNLTTSFNDVRQWTRRGDNAIGAIQQEIRVLIMDVALLKRALTSLGQVGVMERRRIEKELILELFPPGDVRPGTGVAVAWLRDGRPKKLDCEERLPLCQAACCRIHNVSLTAAEVLQGQLDWNPRMPYTLHKNRFGCVHLHSADCSCSIYESRPSVCSSYSCNQDKRIWVDYEKKILNPDLEKRLASLPPKPETPPAKSAESGTGDAVAKEPEVAPPDFSKLREMIVPEPAKKFVPPVASEPKDDESDRGNGNEKADV